MYAIDLLGFGDSDKAALDYSIELWRDQVADFVAQVVGKPAALVGNSIGSLVSLAAAHKDAEGITGVACLNCAGALANAQRNASRSTLRGCKFALCAVPCSAAACTMHGTLQAA